MDEKKAANPLPIESMRHVLMRMLRVNQQPLMLWLGWQIAMFVFPFWAGFLFPVSTAVVEQPPIAPSSNLLVERLVRTWTRYDAGYYTAIAMRGYNISEDAAFYPFYPLTIRTVATTTRLSTFGYDGYNISGIIVSSFATLAVFCLLYRLTQLDSTECVAQRAILYLAAWPMSFFFTAIYSEALFLAVTLGAFYMARRSHWREAWGLATLAVLTRNQGLCVILALLFEYGQQANWQSRAFIRRNAVWLLQPIVAFGLWLTLNSVIYDDPLAFVDIQKAWGKTSSTPFHTLSASWTLFTEDNRFEFWPHSIHDYTREVIDLPFTLLSMALSVAVVVAGFKGNIPWSYAIYSISALTMPLFFMFSGGPLQSMPRYGLVLFPCFMILARLGKLRVFHFGYIIFSIMLLGLFLTRFTLYYFVA
jgi:hypothetical protein